MCKTPPRTAIVTGGSSGIGRATAKALADKGVTVGVVARSRQAVELVCESDRARLIPIVCDVRDFLALRQSYSEFCDGLSERLDYLVNCAGINIPTGLVRSELDEWQAVIDTNLTGTFYSCKAATPWLATGSAIVNVSSTQAHLGGRSPQYAASKAGVEGMSRSIARELGARGIRVNTVAPGATETGMASTWDAATRARLEQQTIAGGVARPEQVSDAILFLLSDAAAHLVGSVLHVNGGAYLN